MNRKIFALFALTAGMHLAVHASENVNTPENRQFLKQQENLSRQLREKPDHQLKAWAEKQVLENPLQRKRLVRTVLIFTESSDQLSRATDRVPGLPASPGYVQ